MDLWPFVSADKTLGRPGRVLTVLQSDPILYILDPEIAQQVTVETSLPKYKALREFMIYLAGPGDIVSSNGEHWKKWRQIMVSLN